MVNSTRRYIRILLMVALAAEGGSASARFADKPPNVVLIVADDLGFSDLGCYGSEISTPNLDALAKQGLRFTQFYNTARCWPSRAAILTGYYAQQVHRDTVPGIKSGTEGVRPGWAPLLPDMLKPLGYRSYHSGKWHLDQRPITSGFDRSYSLNDHDRHFAPKSHTEDDKPLAPAKSGSGYYSSTAISDHAIKCLADHRLNHSSRPFFSFVAFTAPHFPVQAPPEDISNYRNRYLGGWDKMRSDRWQRMKKLGIGGTNLSAIERELGPPYAFPEAMKALGPNEINLPWKWASLNHAQRNFQSAKMAVHAAMVDRMDREIGRIVAQIRSMGEFDNTVIMFLSDNGASAEMMVRGDGHDPNAECGTGATFLCIGPGWSSMANTPFRRHKTWVHEGGISTPLIVSYPNAIVARGELRHAPGHIIDLVPTILELAGSKPSKIWNGKPVPQKPGVSLVPFLLKDETNHVRNLWWLHEGNRALRSGDYKIVAAGADALWELYDMKRDRSESKNLALKMPDKVRKLAEQWTEMRDQIFRSAGKD